MLDSSRAADIAARKLSTEERYGSIQLVKAMKDVVVTRVLSHDREIAIVTNVQLLAALTTRMRKRPRG